MGSSPLRADLSPFRFPVGEPCLVEPAAYDPEDCGEQDSQPHPADAATMTACAAAVVLLTGAVVITPERSSQICTRMPSVSAAAA
jgi:hypothetical protein